MSVTNHGNQPANTSVAETSQPQASSNGGHSKYLRILFISVAVGTLAVASFNWMIDPYLRFGSPRWEGINAKRPAAIGQVRMAKAYESVRRDYQTLLLGNSRVDVGFDPESAAFPDEWRPVYNLGQPGTNAQTALGYLQNVIACKAPKYVILGVDFMDHLVRRDTQAHRPEPASKSPDFDRLAVGSTPQVRWQRAMQQGKDCVVSTLSMSAFLDSVKTLRGQYVPTSPDISPQGFNSGQAFIATIRSEGQAALFEQKNMEYAKRLRQRFASEDGTSPDLKAIREILQLCKSNDIQLILVTYPYHADVLEIFEATGHWRHFEQWKIALADLSEEWACAVWDFSEVNARTTEQPPATMDHQTVMKWYWESGHHRSELGDEMLARMLDPSQSVEGSELTHPDSIGVALSKGKIDTHLQRCLSELKQYQAVDTPHRTQLRNQLNSLTAQE